MLAIKRLKLCRNLYKILVSVMPKLCQNAKSVLAVSAILAISAFWHFGILAAWHFGKLYMFISRIFN